MNPMKSPDQRRCGILCHVDVRAMLAAGCTYDEVAVAACVSRKTVESYARRAGMMVGRHLRGRRPMERRRQMVRM